MAQRGVLKLVLAAIVLAAAADAFRTLRGIDTFSVEEDAKTGALHVVRRQLDAHETITKRRNNDGNNSEGDGAGSAPRPFEAPGHALSPPPVYGPVYGAQPPPIISSPEKRKRRPPPPPPPSPVTYTLECKGPGSIVKALPLDAEEPYIRLKLTNPRDATNEANNVQCESLCAAENGACKAFYYRTDGRCFLFKGYGRLLDGEYDTLRACHLVS